MADEGRKFDPKVLQARWVLGGLDPEELSDQAVIALQRSFGGSALEQLAGMVRPTKRDLGNLPERAFAEMGLDLIDKGQAVDVLMARGEALTCDTISALVEAFPGFSQCWRKHIERWGGKPAGPYNDMSKFVDFVVEDLYEKGNLSETRRVFEELERRFAEGDQETRDLIGYGFFETLRCVASWRSYGNKVFEQFLGPMSLRAWQEIQQRLAGKPSLMDVIRAERGRH